MWWIRDPKLQVIFLNISALCRVIIFGGLVLVWLDSIRKHTFLQPRVGCVDERHIASVLTSSMAVIVVFG